MSKITSLRAAKRPSQISARADDPDTWPIVWRVVAPACGSHDHDMVFLETQNEAEALEAFKSGRRQGYPVRLERVSCGSLPKGALALLKSLWSGNAQKPGTKMREVLGAWEVS
jgi:hypothetical protein